MRPLLSVGPLSHQDLDESKHSLSLSPLAHLQAAPRTFDQEYTELKWNDSESVFKVARIFAARYQGSTDAHYNLLLFVEGRLTEDLASARR